MAADTVREDRFRSLDGLRGVAAVVVVLDHCMQVFAPSTLAPILVSSPLHIFWAGSEAVFVFFILSGFVLTLPVLRSTRFNWLSYYPSRVVRLYIPVIGSVLLALVWVAFVSRRAHPGDSPWIRAHDQPISALSVLRDMTLVSGVSPLNGPLWSLRWEVLFSLLLPAFVLIAVKLRRVWWLVAVGAMTAIVLADGLHKDQWVNLVIFIVGVLLAVRIDLVARLCAVINASSKAHFIWVALTVAAVLGITSNWWLAPVLKPPNWGMTIIVAGASTAVVFAAIGWRSARDLLETRPMQWIGALSFSLYLTHEPIVLIMARVLPRTSMWLLFPCVLVLAVCVSLLFRILVERPAHRLAGRLRREPLLRVAWPYPIRLANTSPGRSVSRTWSRVRASRLLHAGRRSY